MFPGEREDVRPVLFARAVHDHAHDAFLRRRRHERRDIGADSRILQMIVSVVEPHVFLASAAGFQQRRSQVTEASSLFAALVEVRRIEPALEGFF